MTTWTVRQWIGINALAVGMAIACGALLASYQGRMLNVAHPDIVEDIRWWRSLVEIVGQNGRVWLFMLAGIVSFGAAGLSALLSNGFRFGMDLAALILTDPGEVRFLLAHGVLEFAALTVGAAACQYLGCALFNILTKSTGTQPIRDGVLAFGWSCVAGLTAACIEAVVHVLRLT